MKSGSLLKAEMGHVEIKIQLSFDGWLSNGQSCQISYFYMSYGQSCHISYFYKLMDNHATSPIFINLSISTKFVKTLVSLQSVMKQMILQ